MHLSMLSQTDNDLEIHSETFLKTRFALFALRDRKSSLVGGADLDSIFVPLVQMIPLVDIVQVVLQTKLSYGESF